MEDGCVHSTSTTGEAFSSSTPKDWKYDVFLSFRGKDTRKGFTDHLYQRLKDHRVNVFIDENELTRGESITDELVEAIKRSRIAVVIFSKGYADSKWCLDELEQIIECRRLKLGQIVLPVFYDVDPTDVRHQTGSFEQAFQKHAKRFHAEPDKVERWKSALTEAASLSGGNLRNTDGYEGKFVGKIVDDVTRRLNNRHLHVATNQIGIDRRVQHISNYLHVGQLDCVRIIGICGMVGTGKTTVADAIFKKFHHEFEWKSFLPNVREGNMVQLQKKLLCDILKPAKKEVSSVAEGTEELKARFRGIRVLVIIDDIDSEDQINKLAIERGSFGIGSIIIITTRNERCLSKLDVDQTCSAEPLNKQEALELLRYHAFTDRYPDDAHYRKLSSKVVKYCGGLPLALEVLGSYLRKRTKREWRSLLQKLKRMPHGEIHAKLKISYDGLIDRVVKAIFLDISCFFTGMNKDYVMAILDGCDFDPDIGIAELRDRCLVTVDEGNNLVMHDLLRDTGREIVREQSSVIGERSRLWDHEDVKDVLTKHSGTEKIEGVSLDLQESHKSSFSTEAFRNMQGLRLLKLKGVEFTGNCEGLSSKLRLLCWPEFPLEYLPDGFDQPDLVDMDLSHSHIKYWKDPDEPLKRLKFLNLGHCGRLEQSPDFEKLPNLESLILENCKSLSEIHDSIVCLKNLKYLDLRGNDFKELPILSVLSKLRTLRLDKCTNLQAIPDLPTNLEILEADECISLVKMPDFSRMLSMIELHLNHSPELSHIPGLDKSLNSMIRIHMEGCTGLTAAFKEAILQGWNASGNGGLFLPGNNCPPWFKQVDDMEELHVPLDCALKALTMCIIYSSDDPQSGDSLQISVVNNTQQCAFSICPTKASVITSREDYLWLGHLSNNKLNVEGGDKINVSAQFIGPGSTDDIYLRVKKIGVNWERQIIKEYTLDCVPLPFSSEHNVKSIKRSRCDPTTESNAEEETDAEEDSLKRKKKRR